MITARYNPEASAAVNQAFGAAILSRIEDEARAKEKARKEGKEARDA